MTHADLLLNADLTVPENADAHEQAMNLPAAERIARLLGMHPVDLRRWLGGELDCTAIDDEIRDKLGVADDAHPLVILQARGILNAHEVEALAD